MPSALAIVMPIALVASALGITRLSRGAIGRPIRRSTRIGVLIGGTVSFMVVLPVGRLSFPATMTLERLSDVGGIGLGLWCLGWALTLPVRGDRVRL